MSNDLKTIEAVYNGGLTAAAMKSISTAEAAANSGIFRLAREFEDTQRAYINEQEVSNRPFQR